MQMLLISISPSLYHLLKSQTLLLTAVVIFSSPEHEVLMVSYCDHAVSVVNFLPCVHSRGHIFSPILMKLGQNVCLDKISDEFEIGSCGVKN